MSSHQISRQPSGQPAGGQFAATARPSSGLTLSEEEYDTRAPTKTDSLLKRRHQLREASARLDAEADEVSQHLVSIGITEAVPRAGQLEFSRHAPEGVGDDEDISPVILTSATYDDGSDMQWKDRMLTFDAYQRSQHQQDITDRVVATGEPVRFDANKSAVNTPGGPNHGDDVPVTVAFTNIIRPELFDRLPDWPASQPEPKVDYDFDDGRVESIVSWGDNYVKTWAGSDGEKYRSSSVEVFHDGSVSPDDIDAVTYDRVVEYADAVYERVDQMTYSAQLGATLEPNLRAEIMSVANNRLVGEDSW